MDNFQTYLLQPRWGKIVMICSVAGRASRVRWRLCVCVGQTDALSDVDWPEGSGQCTGHRPPCGEVTIILLKLIVTVSYVTCFFEFTPRSPHTNLLAIWWSHDSVSRPSLCSGLQHGTNYLHLQLCRRWTWHYKRFGASWRRTCSSSNCSSTSATLTGAAVAVTVSAAPNIKLSLSCSTEWFKFKFKLKI